MANVMIGFIMGLVVATVGVKGISNIGSKAVPIVDAGVKGAQTMIKDAAK